MSNTMTVKEAAILWNLTERRVASLCKEGKIKGAAKKGRSWIIPANAEKPIDNRVKSGIYKKHLALQNSLCQSVYPITVWLHLNITILIRQ